MSSENANSVELVPLPGLLTPLLTRLEATSTNRNARHSTSEVCQGVEHLRDSGTAFPEGPVLAGTMSSAQHSHWTSKGPPSGQGSLRAPRSGAWNVPWWLPTPHRKCPLRKHHLSSFGVASKENILTWKGHTHTPSSPKHTFVSAQIFCMYFNKSNISK